MDVAKVLKEILLKGRHGFAQPADVFSYQCGTSTGTLYQEHSG
jgi:hypothetical protein